MRIVRWVSVVLVAALALTWRVLRARRASNAHVWADATDRL
ncbi:MAG TPA: hypothetical protein PLA49_10605 [Propioniciclava sp.]|nr:hypothetical protein [Propioniciclava sp.]HRL49818.1 hypothetical protein [Propioniciclava sp.]